MIAARASQYADDPVGATGMMVNDYHGKNGEQVVWRFDAELHSARVEILQEQLDRIRQVKREISRGVVQLAIRQYFEGDEPPGL